MGTSLRAIRYKNIDEARQVLKEVLKGDLSEDIFDDEGEEPQGLLSVIPEDRLDDEIFYRLFDAKKGSLVEVEKVVYSGYGPPADEPDYMGFASEQSAYIIAGTAFPIWIGSCSFGATDFHHLDALVLDGLHPINRDDLEERLGLTPGWDFDTLFDLISEGRYTAEELDDLIHKGVQ